MVLATVVKVAGSAYRRPGARMLFDGQGRQAGFISGGCLEADLAERAGEVLATGHARTIVYDMRSPDDIVWGLGLGCNGEVSVLLERLDPAAPAPYLARLAQWRERRTPGVLATVFHVEGPIAAAVGDRLTLEQASESFSAIPQGELVSAIRDDARGALAERESRIGRYVLGQSRVEALIEFVGPPVSLAVFGAGSDARPLVRLAAQIGWEVTVLDNREAHARPDRFPEARAVRIAAFDELEREELVFDSRSAAVVLTHHFLHDLKILRFLLHSPVPYVGLIGPRQRSENLLRELERQEFRADAGQLERLHAPVGLDIGSESAEEIALSVVAEIQAVLGRRKGGFLRERQGPLHDWNA